MFNNFYNLGKIKYIYQNEHYFSLACTYNVRVRKSNISFGDSFSILKGKSLIVNHSILRNKSSLSFYLSVILRMTVDIILVDDFSIIIKFLF